ncbi:MAG TPA: dihydropteroate synthase [Acidobacteriaceae bacterium]|nr:dihydropteroate synthase [Acidobacteriaceae bacterium]
MGILNVTPDSFSDGGRFFSAPEAVDRALEMLDEGADIIDIGGESTRPGSVAITASEEQERVLPVIRLVMAARPEAVLSIDTYHAETARAAVEAGAEIVNDVSGHLWDPGMGKACAELGCGDVLMHTRGRPSEWRTQPALQRAEVVPLVLRELSERAEAALGAGIARESIVLDPGFGFGKIMGENLPLLAGFGEFGSLGYPLLAGLSRKSFLTSGRRGGAGPGGEEKKPEVEFATSAANMAALLAGAHILRVHTVTAARQVAELADRVLDSTVDDSSQT